MRLGVVPRPPFLCARIVVVKRLDFALWITPQVFFLLDFCSTNRRKMFPIGYRPKPEELRAIQKACSELNCSRSDLLRMSTRETLEVLHQQGFTTTKATIPI